MALTDTAHIQLTPDLRICRILNGMWQVSGAHGAIQPQAAVRDMLAYHDLGLTTWDLADHYGPAEEFIGAFRRLLAAERGVDALARSQAFTKWVPQPGRVTRQHVQDAIARSRARMEVDTLDLLQFHWWEYRDANYLTALGYLNELRQAGQIRHLALTNFDTHHLDIITRHGIPIVSNQVQYSLIDQRPTARMVEWCQAHGVMLLAYGVLCGGLLSERYLAQPEPASIMLNTASLRKYKQMIDMWGGWSLFQELLVVLKHVADRHAVSIANVAVRAILDRPAVAGVIIGARLGVSQHLADNLKIWDVQLDEDDLDQIVRVQRRSNNVFQSIGDCGDEYRR